METNNWNPSPSFLNLNGSMSVSPSEDMAEAKWLENVKRLSNANNMYEGSAADQINKYVNSLYAQANKLQDFYKMGKVYMINTNEEIEKLNSSTINIINKMGSTIPKM